MDLDDYQPTLALAQATTLPARWYTDPRMLDLEKQKVFGSTWQQVAHSAAAANRCDFVPAEVTGEPIIIVRGEDNRLRSFSNVCRHRASTILDCAGNGRLLRCPYHGWTYGLDGRCIAQPEFEGVENWGLSQASLPQFDVDQWGPFLFARLKRGGVPLTEMLGDIPQRAAAIGCDFDTLRFHARKDYIIECNWKVYIDNYLEGYHVPVAHPGLFRELDYREYRVETHRYYSSHFAPIRPPVGDGSRRYGSEAESAALYYWVFPNFMLNIYPDNMSSNVILPLGHDRTLTIFEWFFQPERLRLDPDIARKTMEFSDEIQREDIKLCEGVQKGLQSRTYNTGRFSLKRENGVHHFHLLLHEFLTA